MKKQLSVALGDVEWALINQETRRLARLAGADVPAAEAVRSMIRRAGPELWRGNFVGLGGWRIPTDLSLRERMACILGAWSEAERAIGVPWSGLTERMRAAVETALDAEELGPDDVELCFVERHTTGRLVPAGAFALVKDGRWMRLDAGHSWAQVPEFRYAGDWLDDQLVQQLKAEYRTDWPEGPEPAQESTRLARRNTQDDHFVIFEAPEADSTSEPLAAWVLELGDTEFRRLGYLVLNDDKEARTYRQHKMFLRWGDRKIEQMRRLLNHMEGGVSRVEQEREVREVERTHARMRQTVRASWEPAYGVAHASTIYAVFYWVNADGSVLCAWDADTLEAVLPEEFADCASNAGGTADDDLLARVRTLVLGSTR